MGIGIACMLGVVALWSVVPVLVKLLIPVFDPFTIAFLRLSQAAAVVLVVFFVRGHSLRDIRLCGWHLIGGLGIGLNYSMFALSLSYTTASAGVLIVQVQYVTLVVLATLVLHERLGLGKVAGMASDRQHDQAQSGKGCTLRQWRSGRSRKSARSKGPLPLSRWP